MVYLKYVENVIPLSKLIGLLFLFCLPLLSILFLKTKRNDLARPVMGTIFLVSSYELARPIMGTIFLVYIYMLSVCLVCQITWNHVNQTRACSKSVLGGKIRPVTPILFVSSIR